MRVLTFIRLSKAVSRAALTAVVLLAAASTGFVSAAEPVLMVELGSRMKSATLIKYTTAQADPWGPHSGRYDWNHYWNMITPEIYSPPRPWRWAPFTIPVRRFPLAVPYHHTTEMFGGWTYDYRANAAVLINLFPDYVIRQVNNDTRALHFSAYEKALSAEIGNTVTWASGRIRGAITTIRDGWSRRRYCREFRQQIYIDERPQQAVGTVCQERGGEWKIAPNQ